ncbi:MAG: rod shape-determining protein MreC [Clostridia bacterium]|nr:rod shape-determining protein MreC [Clostridia bacterium]
MKIPHRKHDLFIPYMFALAFVLSGICFLSHFTGTSTFISKGLSFITTPLRAGTRFICEAIDDTKQHFRNVDKLLEENKAMSQEIYTLQSENERLKRVDSENQVLYRFLGLKRENTDYRLTNAKIISRSNSGYISTFSLNKGSFHEITENMPVITSTGALVGVTYSVDSNSCRCTSILSYDTHVGVYSENCGETGLLSGSFDVFGENKCVIAGLPDNTQIKVGDTILTSGLGEIYPRDLKIGTVESFIREVGSQTKSAIIKLDSSIINAENVMILTGFEREYN